MKFTQQKGNWWISDCGDFATYHTRVTHGVIYEIYYKESLIKKRSFCWYDITPKEIVKSTKSFCKAHLRNLKLKELGI